VQSLDALDARPIAGTEDATYPFWSPDSASIAFFAGGKLQKIAIAGGLPLTICATAPIRGGTWNRDGVILFAAGIGPILRVPAAGGTPEPVTRLEPGSRGGHRFPAFLPDGNQFLYHAGGSDAQSAGVYLATLDGAPLGSARGRPAARLLPDETNALYLPPADGGSTGGLVFRRDTRLMTQAFDPGSRAVSGEAFPVAEDVAWSEQDGYVAFSTSSTGTLAYRTGGADATRELVWTDRSGKRLARLGQAAAFSGAPAIAPDARTIAVSLTGGAQTDIWLHDVDRDVRSRFTFRAGYNRRPVWSPDGTRLAFGFRPLVGSSDDIYVTPSSGGGREELLLQGGVNASPMDWSADGRWLVYQQHAEATGLDLWLLQLDGNRAPVPYLQTRFDETNARFVPQVSGSPRWLAYDSDEGGQRQVYVQSIPAGAKYQVSPAGGTQPVWRRDGRELLYLSRDRKLMAVPIVLGAAVQLGPPRELFSAEIDGYDVSADGQRVLVNVPAGGAMGRPAPITVVLRWTGFR
jgi:Tol biopolymer transport system component